MRQNNRPHGTGSVRKMGRAWEGRFSHRGKPKSVNLGPRQEIDPVHGRNKTEAYSALQKVIATYAAPETDKITFADFCPKFIAHKEAKNRSKTTLAAIDVAIRVHLEPEFGDRYMRDITADDIETWMAKEMKKASPKSVKNWRSVAHSIFEYAKKKRVVPENIVAQTEAPYVPRNEDPDVMTMADIAAVRASFSDTPMGRLLSLIVLVAARCGLRESEIIALRWRDILWDTGWIHVIRGHVRGETKLPKGKRGRNTPMPRIVKDPLYAYSQTTPWGGPEDLVFGHPVDGSELDASALNERFKEAVIASGIRPTELRKYKKRNGEYELRDYVKLTFHDCRHAWASWCLANGQSIRSVQQWGGYEDLKTLQVYAHYVPSGYEVDALNAAIEREQTALKEAISA